MAQARQAPEAVYRCSRSLKALAMSTLPAVLQNLSLPLIGAPL
ncbi:nitronate monooxygenase, partial [Verminephrobacter sp. Larva24]